MKAIHIADYIIDSCGENGLYMNYLKLMRVMYFVQAEFLVSASKKCFEDKIEAWPSGPVIRSVLKRYGIYGTGAIPLPLKKRIHDIPPDDAVMIDEAVHACSQYSAYGLLKIIRQQTPWQTAWQTGGEITCESLADFFQEEKK